MGACSFYHEMDGTSAGECFDELVEQAHHDYGYDSYNGTISTCCLGRVVRIADTYSKSAEQKARKYIEDDNWGRKWEATCLDVGVFGYEVVSVKKQVLKPLKPAKYETKYVVLKNDADIITSSYKKTEADEKAMQLSLQDPHAVYSVSKRPVNINRGDDRVSAFEVAKSIKKSRPKSVKKNTVVRELHRYVYYGFAAE